MLAILDLITNNIYPENAVGIFVFEVVSAAVPWLRWDYKKPRAKVLFSLAAIRTAPFHFVAIAKENNYGRTISGFRPCPAA